MDNIETHISKFCDKVDSITSKLHQDVAIISSDLTLSNDEYTIHSFSKRNQSTPSAGQHNISRRDIVHRRNLILTLYSYWESIIKESSDQYLKLIEDTTTDASKLCKSLLILHKWSYLKSCGYTAVSKVAKMEAQACLLDNQADKVRPKLSRIAVRPNSNLTGSRFIEICQWLNINLDNFAINTDTQFPNSTPTQNHVNYTYSGESLVDAINKFVGHRNELAHSAISTPPNIQICRFYYDFIPKIIYAFTSELQEKACNRSWLEPVPF